MIKKELKFKLNKFITYKKFAKKVIKSKTDIIKLFKKLKSKNRKIISYGATYKSTTIFNYCKINNRFLDYVTDTTKNKQGKFTPGTHIPIIPPEIGIKLHCTSGIKNLEEVWAKTKSHEFHIDPEIPGFGNATSSFSDNRCP